MSQAGQAEYFGCEHMALLKPKHTWTPNFMCTLLHIHLEAQVWELPSCNRGRGSSTNYPLMSSAFSLLFQWPKKVARLTMGWLTGTKHKHSANTHPSSHNSSWNLVVDQVIALVSFPGWKGWGFVGKGHGWDIVLLCFLLKHVTIWFPCFEAVNSCSVQRRMVFLHRGWVSFYEPWKVMLFIGKGLSTHIFQFILENIKPSKH